MSTYILLIAIDYLHFLLFTNLKQEISHETLFPVIRLHYSGMHLITYRLIQKRTCFYSVISYYSYTFTIFLFILDEDNKTRCTTIYM